MHIYMDRHDVSQQVTAEIVAQLHQQDLKIQDQFQCRGLTYWFDEKRKAAFCLVEAPSKKAVQKMHQFAHGDVPNLIIEVQPAIVESFLGRIEDPKRTQNTALNIIRDSAFRTIMAIELAWFPYKNFVFASFESSLRRFNYTIFKKLKVSRGSVVRHTGNYFLASFQSVSKAVQAAIEIEQAFNGFQAEFTGGRLSLKIGLAAGVPVTGKELIFEDTVKLAERMCLAVNGRIIVSSEVKALYDSENPASLTGNGIVPITKEDENFLTCLWDYIASSWCDSNLKIDDLTRPLGCSKSQLYRRMVALTGKSPQAFIKEYRLREALILLNKQSGHISEVAYQSGFTSPSYFSKCFRKMYGYSPSDILPGKTTFPAG